jgi:hypothetical protein
LLNCSHLGRRPAIARGRFPRRHRCRSLSFFGQSWRKTAYFVLSCHIMAHLGVHCPSRGKRRSQTGQFRYACKGGSLTGQGIADAIHERRTGISASTI